MMNFLRKAIRCWNWRKPKAMIRLALMFYKVKVQKKMMLRYVDLSIGEKCNMACPHCFVGSQKEIKRKGHKSGRRIHPDYYGKVVGQAMGLGACSFSFQGGEPLVYEDLPRYIKAARPDLNIISVTTNGKALYYHVACKLRKLGVDIVTISIDPFRRDHDNEVAMEAVFTAIRAGLKVTVGTVVSHSTLHGDLFKSLVKKSRTHKFILMVMMAVPIGALAGEDAEMLTEDDVKYLRDLERRLPTVQTDFKVNWLKEGCGAAKEIIYIKHTGETFCCPYIPISFGNVGRHDLETIRKQMLKVPELAQYYPKCIAGEGLWKIF
jgi:MoaA/NifB/PqqE/SkfB family radical SAM enzyme